MKNFIEQEHSCSDEQFETCTGKNNCGQIRKTRNSLILFGFAMLVLAYFLLIPDADKLRDLQAQVKPTASLYSNPKSLGDKFPLINDERKITSLSEAIKSKWAILYFGYASCPDICQTDLTTLNQALSLMKHKNKLGVVFISVDPKRDVGKLSNFVQKFNTEFIGLSAKENTLSEMTKALGISHEVEQVKQKSIKKKIGYKSASLKDDYLIDHTANYLLLSPKLELTALLSNPHHANKMARALDLIIETLD